MRKFLVLSAAVALLALGGINQAKAGPSIAGLGCEQGCTAVESTGGSVALIAVGAMWLYATVGSVVIDIYNGGLNRKYAEAVPGAGYQSRDYANAAKLTHDFNVAMGYSDDADTAKYLASASR